MSGLGVKIKIDFSDVEKLKKAVSSKIPINIDTESVGGKLKGLVTQLESIKKAGSNIDINFNISKAESQLEQLETTINNIKKSMSKGIDLNFDDSGFLGSIKKQAKAVEKSFDNATDNIARNLRQRSSIDKAIRDIKDATTGGLSYSGKEERSVKDQISDLNQIKRVMSEISRMKKSQLGYDKGSDEYNAYAKAIKSRNGYKGALVRAYNATYSGNYMDETIIKQAMVQQELQLNLKKAALKSNQQKAYDKETETRLADYTKLLNEQYSLMKKAQKYGNDTNLGKEYSNQAQNLESIIKSKRTLLELDKRLNSQQKASLKSLESDNQAELDMTRRINEAKSFDAKSLSNFRELKSELKQIYDLQEKIADIGAKEKAGTINSKDDTKLRNLRAELEVAQKYYDQSKKNLELNEKQATALRDYDSKRKLDLNKTSDLAKIKAEAQKIDQAYDEIAQSMKKVSQYNKQMQSAGDNEAAQLRRLIALEEERQQEIRQTNNLKENGSKVREQELSSLKRINQEQFEQAEALRKAKQKDRFREQVSAYRWADIINPREIFMESRQALQYMYGSVKEVEDQIVNIKKVIDPADYKGLKKFRENIYDTASSVGKSAGEYAVSVERWASSGKTLRESIELGRTSTIGAFVGNVDEASMVDYMSVPLIAFKKHGLEATDIINAMNEVANNNAIEMNDLGAAYKRAAGTAAQSGTTFAELNGLITAAQETTRLGGERIGTAFKTLDVNIGKIATRLTKADSTKYEFFKNIGVDMLDATGQMKSTYKVLEDLQSVWSRLNREEQNTAGFYLAGKHHQNILSSILNGWQYVEKARDEALGQIGKGEIGSAYKEFAVQQDSLEFKQVAMKNAWSEFLDVVSGGKPTFAAAMDILTGGMQKATELAKNPALRKLGTTLTSIFAGLTANVALGRGGSLIGKMIDATIMPIGRATDAIGRLFNSGKDIGGEKFTGKIVGGLSKVGAALSVASAAFTAVDIGLRTFTGKGAIERLSEGFDHVYRNIYKAKAGVTDFIAAHEKAYETIRRNDEIRTAIIEHKKVSTTYEKTMEEKRKVYFETGNLKDLELAEQEFEDLKNAHNELVRQMGIGADFNITFNNHEHIMSQLKAVEQQYDAIRRKANIDDWGALKKAQAESSPYSGLGEIFDSNFSYLQQLREYRKNPAEARTPLGLDFDLSEDRVLEHIKNLIEDAETQVTSVIDKQISKISPADIASQISAMETRNTSEKNLIKEFFRNSGKDKNGVSLAYSELFEFLKDGRATESTLFNAMSEVSSRKSETGSIKNAIKDITRLGKEYQEGIKKFAENTDGYNNFRKKYYDQINEIISKNKSLQDYGFEGFSLADAMKDYETFSKFLEKDLPSSYEQAIKHSGYLEQAIKDVAHRFNLTSSEAEKMINNYSNNRAEFIREAFALNENQALDFLNIDTVTTGKALNLSFSLGLEDNIGEVLADIESQISKVKGTDLVIKYGLVKADGSTDFQQVVSMMDTLRSQLDDQLLIELGIKVDGEYRLTEFLGNIDNILATTEGKEFLIEANVDTSGGEATFNSFIEALNNENVTIEPILDGSNIVGWKLTEHIGEEATTIEIDVAVPENIPKLDELANKEITIKTKVEFDPSVTFVNGYDIQQYWDNTLLGNQEVFQKLGVNVEAYINEDGSVNIEKVIQDFVAAYKSGSLEAIEIVQEIIAKYELKPGDELTPEMITQYFSDIYGSGEGYDAEIERLIKVLLRGEIDSSSAEEEYQNAKEGLEEMFDEDGDPIISNVDIELKPTLVNSTSVRDDLISQLQGGQINEVEFIVRAIMEGREDVVTLLGDLTDLGAIGEVITRLGLEVTGLQESEVLKSSIEQIMAKDGMQAVVSFLTEVYGQDLVDSVLSSLGEASGTNYSSQLNIETTGEEDVKSASEAIRSTESKSVTLAADAAKAIVTVRMLKDEIEGLGNGSSNINVGIDKGNFDSGIETVKSSLKGLDSEKATPKADLDTSQFSSKAATVKGELGELDAATASPKVDADISAFANAVNSVNAGISALNSAVATVRINADSSHFYSVLNAVRSESGSVTIGISAQKRSKSVGIGGQIAKSMSVGVGQFLSSALGVGKSLIVGRSKSVSSSVVNNGVSKAIAKDYLSETSLERSVDDLKKEIASSKESTEKLNDSLNKNNFEWKTKRDLKNADDIVQYANHEKALMNLGFVIRHGNIFNPENFAKINEKEAESAKRHIVEWRKYQKKLNYKDFTLLEEEPKKNDEKEKKEKSKLDDILKKTKSLLSIVDANSSIQKSKLSLLDSKDFELNMVVNSEGILSSKSNISQLVEEFNRLSIQYLEFEKNSSDMLGNLETLKKSILENADAILEYRNSINELKIQRLTEDYDKFNQSLELNLGRIKNNTDALIGGLLDGENLSDRASSVMSELDFKRSGFDAQQKERLRLEKDLNDILQEYAEANVYRTKQVAAEVLKIEKSKYAQLLDLASGYEKGVLSSVNTSFETDAIKNIGSVLEDKNSEYEKWQDKLYSIHSEYANQYQKMVKDFDKLNNQNNDSATKTKNTNEFIVDQLKLQENYYKKIIELNSEAIKQAKEILKDEFIKTEHREKLLESIVKYENSSVEAENKIRDVIKDRYDFQFSLLDKEMTRVKSYSNHLDFILKIAKEINLESDKVRPIHEAIFGAKVNEYAKIKKELSSLISEQSKLSEGSYEWKLLEDRIKSTRNSLNDFTIDVLNSNRDILSDEIDIIRHNFQKGLFDGNTLDEWKDYRDSWLTGIQKELALEDLRKRLLDMENDTISRRVEMLDAQDKISQRDMDYLEKQMKIFELQNKLSNIDKERNVQELVRGDDGKWAFAYSVNQNDYDKTKKELDSSRKDLDKYIESQRIKYADQIDKVLDRASKGEYKSPEQLADDINRINSIYGFIAEDDPTFSLMSADSLVEKYRSYLSNNGMIIEDVLGKSEDLAPSGVISGLGLQFERSFLNIAQDLGEIIGKEVREALSNRVDPALGGDTYNIASLEFPNVTNTDGFREVLLGLPSAVRQTVLKKT